MRMKWQSSKSDKEDAEIAEKYAMVAERLGDRRLRRRFIFLFTGLNLVVWLLAVLTPSYVNWAVWSIMSWSNKAGMAILGILVCRGTLFQPTALLRMKFTALEDNKQLESDYDGQFSLPD